MMFLLRQFSSIKGQSRYKFLRFLSGLVSLSMQCCETSKVLLHPCISSKIKLWLCCHVFFCLGKCALILLLSCDFSFIFLSTLASFQECMYVQVLMLLNYLRRPAGVLASKQACSYARCIPDVFAEMPPGGSLCTKANQGAKSRP